MPEGHTLHRVAGALRQRLAGRIVASSSPQGRFMLGAARVDGHRLVDAEAWGKHVMVRFDGVAEQVHVHLGLFGRWTHTDSEDVPVVGEVRWRLRGERTVFELRGPTACELLAPREVAALLARLGPDPIRDDADPDLAWDRISGSRAPLSTLLMDQAVVAGIGNVYRAEVLFRHRLPPGLPGRELDRATWDALWNDLVQLMLEGVRTGRIDTVRSEHTPAAMGREPRDDAHGGEVYVYRRAGMPCLVCATTVLTKIVAARNLFWCPECQREARLTG